MEMNSMRALEVDYTTIRPQLIQGLTNAVADGWTVNGRSHHPFGIYRQAQPSGQVDGIAVRVDAIEINNAPALSRLKVADEAYWKIGRICLGGRFRGKSENNASSGYHCPQNSRHVGASLIVHLRPGSADFASHLMPALPQKQQVATRAEDLAAFPVMQEPSAVASRPPVYENIDQRRCASIAAGPGSRLWP